MKFWIFWQQKSSDLGTCKFFSFSLGRITCWTTAFFNVFYVTLLRSWISNPKPTMNGRFGCSLWCLPAYLAKAYAWLSGPKNWLELLCFILLTSISCPISVKSIYYTIHDAHMEAVVCPIIGTWKGVAELWIRLSEVTIWPKSVDKNLEFRKQKA